MNLLTRWGVTLLFLFSFSPFSFSTHIVGGQIFYDSIGINQYRITIEMYRDCNSATPFDDPLTYTVFLGDGTIFASYYVNYSSLDPLVADPDPCIIVPEDVCIQRAIYVDTLVLPFNASGYTISYQRCCWAPDIMNITNPGDNGLTLTTFIPGSSLVNSMNQSARFTQLPPLFLCSNRTVSFAQVATDPNSDSLVYQLVSPFTGGSQANPIPDPESPPPYVTNSWNTGYSALQPFGPGSMLTLDSQTGEITITPQITGEFITALTVKEYRNGVLIDSVTRQFSFNVVPCDIIEPIDIVLSGDTTMVENCNSTSFLITRTDASSEEVFQVTLVGTATNGVDYSFPDSIVMPVNEDTLVIPITSFVDQLSEGSESVSISILYPNLCNNTFDSISVNLTIVDYTSMILSTTDTVRVCDEQDLSASLSASVSKGVPGYSYNWHPGNYPNSPSMSILCQNLNPGPNLFFVTVTDQCQQSIQSNPILILNECPLVIPNVVTANTDNINDVFIIKNIEDYESVELILTNRWGNVVYENSNYQNDWSGLDKGGERLSAGTYFYTVTPKSDKYSYFDSRKTKYTARGFVEIIH